MENNSCDVFRFGGYEDVFLVDHEEGKRYLYVCAEPHNFPHLFAGREYEEWEGLVYPAFNSHSSYGVPYLKTLEHAPANIASFIVGLEFMKAWQAYNSDNGEDLEDTMTLLDLATCHLLDYSNAIHDVFEPSENETFYQCIERFERILSACDIDHE